MILAGGATLTLHNASAGTLGVVEAPLSLSITAPDKATLGTLAKYTVTEAHGIALTKVTWTFDGQAGGHALTGLANSTVQVWNTTGAHTVRVAARASGGRQAEATASTAVIGAPLASSVFTNCALTPAGEVRCWGYGNYGTLGNDDVSDVAVPVAAIGLSGMLGLAGGRNHICGVTSGRTAQCWGNNISGQLGNAQTFHSGSNPLPLPVDNLTDVVSMVGGQDHTCALKTDGTVACFGDNTYGELGIGSVGGAFVEPQPVPGLSNVVALSAGRGLYTCALKADGAVLCWGNNEVGELGDGKGGEPRSSPGPVLNAAGDALAGVLALRSGRFHSCAILDDGQASVVCWGDNRRNQVSGGASNVLYPATPVPGLSGVTALSTTDDSSCASGFDTSFKCWGDNAYAESDGKGVPGTTLTAPTKFRGLQGAKQPSYGSGGESFLCVLTAKGGAKCVGRGGEGELGDGTFADAYTLQRVQAPAGSFWH